jgi:ribonucleoside-diphosphate reductase alpha chain
MAETTQTSPKAATTPTSAGKPASSGLRFARKFSRAGVSPYDEVQWERRTAAINDMSGKIIFEQKDVRSPSTGP